MGWLTVRLSAQREVWLAGGLRSYPKRLKTKKSAGKVRRACEMKSLPGRGREGDLRHFLHFCLSIPNGL